MYIRFHKGMLSLDTKFLQSMADFSSFTHLELADLTVSLLLLT